MPRIGEILVQRGWITELQLQTALRNQGLLGGRIGTCLLELNALSEDALSRALAETAGLPAAGAEELRVIPPEVVSLLSPRLALRYQAIPFRAFAGHVDLALLEVHNLRHQDELAFGLGRRIRPHVTPEVRLVEALSRHYGASCPPRLAQILERIERSGAVAAPAPLPAAPAPTALPAAAAGAPSARAAAAAAGALGVVPIAARASLGTPSRELPPREAGRDDAPVPGGWAARVRAAEARLATAASASDVGEILLATLLDHFDRALIFRAHRGRLEGWLGRGPGLDATRFRRFTTDLALPSVFRDVTHRHGLFVGRPPALPVHRRLAGCWEGLQDPECAVAPVRVADRLALVLWGDRGGHGLAEVDSPHLWVLAVRAGAALQRCLVSGRGGDPSGPLAARR